MSTRKIHHKRALRWMSTALWLCLISALQPLHFSPSHAQTPAPTPAPANVAPSRIEDAIANADDPDSLDDLTARAIVAVCVERAGDPLGSAPIDEMQSRPSLPVRHPDVVAGVLRAERLLPLARTLTAQILRSLARRYRVPPSAIRVAIARLQAVRAIKPDTELRDNASVLYSDPHTIRFGTLFLAGLRSDESMISVLAHELTHAADGSQDDLALLFSRVTRSATHLTKQRLSTHRAEELTCDLIGTMVARALIAQTPNDEPLTQRASRALEHNCVAKDIVDAAHLSPLNTLRALLALDPALARAVAGEEPPPAPLTSTRALRRAHHVPR